MVHFTSLVSPRKGQLTFIFRNIDYILSHSGFVCDHMWAFKMLPTPLSGDTHKGSYKKFSLVGAGPVTL